MSKFLLITLLVVAITLVSQGNFESEAAIRAMGANPPISVGGYLLKNHDRSNITVTHDADGNVVKRIPVGYDYLVRAAVVASGKGQVSMVSSGQLYHKGKQIMTLGSSSTTTLIGSRFMGIVLPVVVKSVTIESRGRHSVDQKNQSGSYTLKGQSSFAATGHTGGTISFVTPVFQITIGGSTTALPTTPHTGQQSFTVNYIERHPCKKCGVFEDTPDKHKVACNVKSPDGDQEASCINSPYWNCQPHTHQFPSSTSEESGSQSESRSYQGSNPNNDGGDSNNQNSDPSGDQTGGDDPDETNGDDSNNRGTTTAQCKGCTSPYDEANPGHHVARTCYQLGPNGEPCTNKIWDCAQAQHQHSW